MAKATQAQRTDAEETINEMDDETVYAWLDHFQLHPLPAQTDAARTLLKNHCMWADVAEQIIYD